MVVLSDCDMNTVVQCEQIFLIFSSASAQKVASKATADIRGSVSLSFWILITEKTQSAKLEFTN